MKKLLCKIFGHRERIHLAWIWGNLPREEGVCTRCKTTTLFQRPTDERLKELMDDESIPQCDGAVDNRCEIYERY